MAKTVSLILRVATAIAVLVVVGRTVDWAQLSRHLTLDFVIGVAATQPLIIAGTVLLAWRYARLISEPPPPLLAAFNGMVLSIGLNTLLPARTAEVLKASYMCGRCGVALGIGLTAVVLERVLDAVFLGGLALLAMAVLTPSPLWRGVLLALVPIAMTLALWLLLMLRRWAPALAVWLKAQRWRIADGLLQPALAHFQSHFSPNLLVWSTLATLGAWLASALSTGLFLFVADGRLLDFTTLLTLVLALAIGAAVPIFPGGFVTFEGAGVLVLTGAGYDFDHALALTVGIRLCLSVVIIPASLVIFGRHGTGLGTLGHRIAELWRKPAPQ